MGGGATYQFTNDLSATSQATYYDQEYFGKSYTGTYLSGTVNYGKRLLDMFTFSGSVIDSSNGQGTNALGFVGNVNFFHSIKGFQTSGVFTYAQNVQSLLVTYTTSYYSYSANLHRRLPAGLQWTAAFNGTHSGLTNYQGTSSQRRGLFDFAQFAEVYPHRKLHAVDRNLAAGRGRIRAGLRDAGSDRLHYLWRHKLRRRRSR